MTTDTLRTALERIAGTSGLSPDARICREIARAALAAAPQPAPEREALAEVILKAMLGLAPGRSMSRAIADALLARGLRLPGVVDHETALCDTQAPLPITGDTQAETMAWAVVGKDGVPRPHMIFSDQLEARRVYAYAALVRVAIREVKGGDDEA